jgi:nucleotide-binding universal stress UspA family protein
MTILAAVDGEAGSHAAIRHGYDLAHTFDEELVVLHVRPDTEEQEAARAVAQGLVDDVLGDEENVSTIGRLGEPEVRILREADDRDAHYIVLGSRKQTPAGKALFGSVAQIVLLNTDRPVVIVSGSE